MPPSSSVHPIDFPFGKRPRSSLEARETWSRARPIDRHSIINQRVSIDRPPHQQCSAPTRLRVQRVPRGILARIPFSPRIPRDRVDFASPLPLLSCGNERSGTRMCTQIGGRGGNYAYCLNWTTRDSDWTWLLETKEQPRGPLPPSLPPDMDAMREDGRGEDDERHLRSRRSRRMR